MLTCVSKGCKASLEENNQLDSLTSQEIYVKTGWTTSPSWAPHLTHWDGNIWCPDHEVEADDFEDLSDRRITRRL